MLRIAAGLFSIMLPAIGELTDAIPPYEGAWVRPLIWITFPAFGLAALLAGWRAVRRDLAEEAAYAQAPRSRFGLSTVGWGLVHPFLLASLVVFILFAQTEIEHRRSEWPPKEEILHMPRQEVLRLMSIGYREFAADLVWLRAVAYFGDHLHSDHKYQWLDRYLDTVVYLDPRFRSVYKFAGAVSMYNLRRITKEAVLTSIRFLEKGYRQFPNYWEFPFMICSNYLFEMPRYARDAAERKRYREIGAQYCREASLLPGTLYYLPSMAGGVLSKLGQRQLARQHFRELIVRTEDPKVRKQLQHRYAALVSSRAATRLERKATEFFAAHRRSYPYLPSDLFFFVGPRSQSLDAAAEIRKVLAGGRH